MTALWLAASAVPALATVYHVATTGNNSNDGLSLSTAWRTVQYGATNVTAGHTLEIHEGTYYEQVNFANSGTSSNKIIVRAADDETVTITGNAAFPVTSLNASGLPGGSLCSVAWYASLVEVSGSYVEVHGINVTQSRGRGLTVSGDHVLIKHVKVSYVWDQGLSSDATDHVTFEDCEVTRSVMSHAANQSTLCFQQNGKERTHSQAITPKNSTNTTIRRCKAYENWGEGIGDLRSDFTIIEDCVSYDSAYIMLYLDNSQDSIVRRNIIYATDNQAFWRYSDRPSPGIVVNNEDYGGNQNFGARQKIYNNFIYNTGSGFTIWNQGAAGATYTDSIIAYNTFASTRTPAGSSYMGVSLIDTGVSDLVFKNNIVYMAAGTVAGGGTSGFTFSHNNWSANPPTGFGSGTDVINDPELQFGSGTPTSEWLKIPSNSPARDAGDAISGITTDFFGTTRSTPDIVAYEFTIGSAPAAPAALNASAISGTQVDLSWSDVAGETGYRIEWKAGGGGYAFLTNKGAGSTSHSHTTASPGTTYTYRIRAEHTSNGNSAWTESSPVTTPGGGTIGSFTSQDIGGPGIAGSGSLASGVYTVNGGGWDIHGTADQFHFLHQAWSGDGRIVARVTAVENTDPWAKAGLMFRDDTTAGSRNVNLVITPANGTQLLYRSTAGNWPTNVATIPGFSPPYWLRLERHGNTFTGYQSPDGLAWFLTGAATFTLNSNARIGLAVTSHDNADLNTSTFDNVSVSNVPTWTSADVGSVGVSGSSSVNHTTGVFTVNGSGSNITWTADSFQFYYQALTGDVTIIAEVTDVENTAQYAKGGLMIRQSLAADSANALVSLKPAAGASPGVEYIVRASGGGTAGHSSGSPVASITAPRFLKLVRSGNTFTAYQSADAGSWTQVGTAETISMSGTIYVGLVSCANNNSTLCTTTFESVYIAGASGGGGGTPEVNVQGNSVSIADGDSTPSASDHTHFGGVSAASGTISRTFTVQNTGTAALTLGTVSLSGAHASDFTVTTQPASSVSASSSTTFVIEFDPSAPGIRTASLSFSTSDSDENPYNFSIAGNGLGNLLANPGFEATTDWANYPTSSSEQSTTHYSGTYGLKIKSSGFPEVYQQVAVTPGVAYVAKVWSSAWSTDGLSRGQMRLQWYDGGTPLGSAVDVTATTASWAQLQSSSLTAPAGATHLRITLKRSVSLAGNYYFDDAEISIAP